MSKSTSKLQKNTSIYVITNFLSAGVSFLLLPLYTRYLTPEDYGIVAVLTIVSSLMIPLFKMGQDASIARFYFDFINCREDFYRFTGTVLPVLLALDIIVAILLFSTGKYFLPLLANGVPWYPFLVITILTSMFSVLINLATELIRVMEKAVTYSVIQISILVLTILSNIYFVVILQQGALGVIIAGCIISFFSFILALIFFLKNMKFNINLEHIRHSFRFGLPFIPHAFANYGMRLSDTFFLSQFTNLTQVGIYSIAIRISQFTLNLQDSFNGAWNPIFQKRASADENESKIFISEVFTKYLAVSVIVVALVSLFSREFLVVMTTQSFYQASNYVPYLMSALLFRGIYLMATQQLIYKKKMQYLPLSTILASLVNIVLNIVLINLLGAYGAAIATLLANVTMAGICFYYAQKNFHIRYEYPKLLKIFILLAVILLANSFISIKIMAVSIIFKFLLLGAMIFILDKTGIWKINFRKIFSLKRRYGSVL